MTAAKWRFREMEPWEKNLGTVIGEFFNDEPINTRLVREAIQNSLDAGMGQARGNAPGGGGPVRVRFGLGGIDQPLPAEKAARYFDGLPPHLAAAGHAPAGALPPSDVPFLVIEDAGTTGLCGDWRECDTTDSGNHFYWFFRNVGLSGKGDGDNGSWGLGKWVFPDASQVKCYLAVTRRCDDDETLLMGETVLQKHTIGGRRYEPFGYFAALESDAGNSDTKDAAGGPALPLRMCRPEHRDLVRDCIADFGLRFRDEPGLSIIIPWPRVSWGQAGSDHDDDDARPVLNRASLLNAVIRNYFYPIIAGRLEVVVDAGNGNDKGDGATIVNGDTIDRVVAGLDLPPSGEWSRPSYRRLFAICRAGLQLEQAGGEYEVLPSPPSASRAQYDPARLDDWRRRYQAGELLPFRVKTDVLRRGGKRQDTERTELRVYLQRDAALDEGQDYYVRGTLSIHGAMDFIKQRREACALLVVDDRPLAAMLRDSEPPAHTAWSPSAGRASDRWVAAPRRIRAVRDTPRNLLYQLLETATEEVQKDAFADIFFWDGGADDASSRGREIKEGQSTYQSDKTEKSRTSRRRTPPDFEIAQSPGGFRVRLANGLANPPACAYLRVAYEVPRGNPLNRYQPEDFRLHGRPANLSLQMGGCGCRPGKAGNEVFLDIENPDDFEFAVSGFDPKRDVHIRIERVAEGTGAEADE